MKIVNNQGQNLIFGASALYNADSIRILEQKNNLSITNAFVTKQVADSTLIFDFYKILRKSYIYYNQQTPRDSLEIKWITKIRECCGEKNPYYEVDSVIFNNAFIKPVNGVCTFVK